MPAGSRFWPAAPTAGEVLERIRREYRNESEKGRWFENLFKRLILDAPHFEVEQAWRWADWPDREARGFTAEDIGTDLVAVLRDGSLVAIQCKCYKESDTVQNKDIDKFLARSGAFDMRWVVATCGWGRNAEESVRVATPSVRRIDFHEYDGERIREGTFQREERTPWGIQSRAIENVVNGLQDSDRGQLVMACGTGKTFTSFCISEKLVPDGGRILYLAPSIALVSQVRREWLRYGRTLKGLVVCSDSTSGGSGENDDMRISEMECQVTTEPQRIADFLRQDAGGTRVVFCTYQSLAKVSVAQIKHGAPAFDLTIADEAHRTTGVEGTAFRTVHDGGKLSSRKRLYMTATQRIFTSKSKGAAAKKGYDVTDMDDHDTYGRVLHRLSFKEAVDDDKLSNYRVIVMGSYEPNADSLYDAFVSMDTVDGKKHLKPQDVTRLLGVAKAVNGATRGMYADTPELLSKVIGFSNSRARSRAFTKLLNMPELHDILEQDPDIHTGKRHEVEHLDGTSSSLARNRALRELESANVDSPRMISNVKLFTEGVDVPSLDAVAFLDPRSSTVDVVQAVGRVMRRAEGKQLGYIIVPVLLEPGESLIEALERNSDGWRATGQVLRALASHDNRLPENPWQFLQLYDSGMPPGEDSIDTRGIQTTLNLQEMSQRYYTQIVSSSGLSKPGKLISDDITYAVETASRLFLKDGMEQDLAGALGLVIGDDEFTGKNTAKIAALLVINACLLHRRLLGIVDGLSDLNAVASSDKPCDVLAGAWELILEDDYKPIFRPVLPIMRILSASSSDSVNRAVHHMADVANRIADSLSELGYDHSGPLYHGILGTAKSDSANYTDNVSALMLARLAFTTDGFTDWDNPDTVRRLRIMDPACGTGTLLMAALKTIKDRVGYDRMSAESQESMHRGLVEEVLCGLDINRHAVQLAACNLTLGAPTVDYKKMNLYTMKHGPQSDNGGVKAGSVEILRAASDRNILETLVQPMKGIDDLQAEHVDDEGDVDFPLKNLHAVIMNPPFGSNVARSRKYPPDVVKQMQENELDIRAELRRMDTTAGETIDSNSISTFFTPLADRLLDPERGTLAKVLPVTACTNVSGLVERKFLADRFHVEHIITSHDPKRVNFSYKTGIHECLMVCRRYNGGGPKPPTEFVSLHRMPKIAKEAVEAADAIASGTPGDWGSVTSWPAERVAAGDWSPVQWSDAGLAGAVLELESSELLEPVGVRHEIGPAGQRIHDAYEKCGQNDDGAVMIFDSISSKLRRTIHSAPESWHHPKRGEREKRLAKIYWKQRSILLVAKKMDTISGRLTALYSDEATVGKGWTPVSVVGERIAKALAVWWNSTPARMMLLNRRSKKLTYPQWSLAHLKEIRIPKPGNPAWHILTETYDKVCDEEISPMSNADDPVRVMIDDAAAKVLGAEPEVLAGWRRRLSREPTIRSAKQQQHGLEN
ncbi:MAG: DEAD/DEAH box helicase family protein [Thaumarchaeota archaeon]|nr:DEAD/DEAH box helicase family protein [Nitrososphaerota archaeon]